MMMMVRMKTRERMTTKTTTSRKDVLELLRACKPKHSAYATKLLEWLDSHPEEIVKGEQHASSPQHR